MDKNSSTPTLLQSKNTKDLSRESISKLNGFFKSIGVFNLTFPSLMTLTTLSLSPCLAASRFNTSTVARFQNFCGALHGAVGAVTVRVAAACARTIVGKDKELFLGELSISYLSGAPRNAEVIVNTLIIRSGRNLTVVMVDFRVKDSEKLCYTSHATLYHMPVASL